MLKRAECAIGGKRMTYEVPTYVEGERTFSCGQNFHGEKSIFRTMNARGTLNVISDECKKIV